MVRFVSGAGLLAATLLLTAAQPLSYQPVVADARTRAALPGTTALADGQPYRTDAAGRLALPTRPRHLQLSHVGYQTRQWQPAPLADTLWLTPQPVLLPGVRVKAQPGQTIWRYPGKTRWPYDAFAVSLSPGQQVAMFYRPADSTRQYHIRAVRIRLGHRAPNSFGEAFGSRRHFVAGRLRVSLQLPGPDGAPATPLGPQAWTITPDQSEGHNDGWLRLELPADAALLVPRRGVFIVATSLSDHDTDAPTRIRSLVYQRRNPQEAAEFDPRQVQKGGTNRVNLYVETPAAGADKPRLIPLDDYPAIAQQTVLDEAVWHSWHCLSKHWQELHAYHAEMKQRFPASTYTPRNYQLELEVEEL